MKSPELKIKKSASRANPDIVKVEVGIRELKKLTLYPLSAYFQLDLAKSIGRLLTDFFSIKVNDLSDVEVSRKLAEMFIELFQENVEAVFDNVFDPAEVSANGYESSEELLKDTSTKQFVEIGDIVYKNNYEVLVGKITSYLRKKQGEEPSLPETVQKIASATKNVSPSSVDTMEPTNSETSPSPTTKEE